MALPTLQEIQKWDDKFLLSVILAGENIDWKCRVAGESQSDVDEYVTNVYNEKERRSSIPKPKESNNGLEAR